MKKVTRDNSNIKEEHDVRQTVIKNDNNLEKTKTKFDSYVATDKDTGNIVYQNDKTQVNSKFNHDSNTGKFTSTDETLKSINLDDSQNYKHHHHEKLQHDKPGVIKTIYNNLTGMLGNGANVVSSTVDATKNATLTNLDGAKNTTKDILETTKSSANSVYETQKEVIGDVLGGINNAIHDSISGTKETVKRIVVGTEIAAEDIGDSLTRSKDAFSKTYAADRGDYHSRQQEKIRPEHHDKEINRTITKIINKDGQTIKEYESYEVKIDGKTVLKHELKDYEKPDRPQMCHENADNTDLPSNDTGHDSENLVEVSGMHHNNIVYDNH